MNILCILWMCANIIENILRDMIILLYKSETNLKIYTLLLHHFYINCISNLYIELYVYYIIICMLLYNYMYIKFLHKAFFTTIRYVYRLPFYDTQGLRRVYSTPETHRGETLTNLGIFVTSRTWFSHFGCFTVVFHRWYISFQTILISDRSVRLSRTVLKSFLVRVDTYYLLEAF